MSVTRCHFDSDGRPYVWLEAPELVVGSFSALVDTGFNATVLLPAGQVEGALSPRIKGLARRFTGEAMEMDVFETTIVFNGRSKRISCGAAPSSHAVVGILFLEAFQQTLMIFKRFEESQPVALLVDNQPMFAALKSLWKGLNYRML